MYVWLRKFVLFRSSLVVMRHDSEQQVCFTDTATYRYMKEIEKVIHGPHYLNHQILRYPIDPDKVQLYFLKLVVYQVNHSL